MRLKVSFVGLGLVTWCGVAVVAAAPAPPGKAVPAAAPVSPAALEFFEKEVRPLLAQQCYSCHGEKVQQGGLRLDSREALVRGGARGTALAAGKPEKSLLIQAVRHQGMQMPPGRKLPEKQVAALEKWVQMGAPWPGSSAAAAPATGTWDDILKTRKQWWSLLPVRRTPVPKVKLAAWSRHPVDRFILADLEAKGLKPAVSADRRTLIRRVSLVLTGLPPTPEEVEAFAGDRSPTAYEKVVDRLLASPHFGERWARHWMDVVRFCETHGYEWNNEIRDVWRYRDYLIRAFNQDLPYDQLIREHIAGDLLPQPRRNAAEQINESVIGTAFYRFGEVGHDVFKEIGLDHLDNQIDTLSKAFQATTVSCARCHDHKLDAVSTRDYYGILGIVASSRQVVHTIDGPEVNRKPEERLKALKSQIRAEAAQAWQQQAGELGKYLGAAQAARDKRPDAEMLATGLDAARLKAVTAEMEKGGGIEAPLYGWSQLAEAASKGGDLASAWKSLAERCAAESRDRAEFNRKTFLPWGDFTKGVPEGWRAGGLGLRDGPSISGDFAVPDQGEQAVSGVFPAGFFTHTLSERMNGSVQSPYLPPGKKFAVLEVMGGKHGAARFVPDFRLLQDSSTVQQGPLSWKRFRIDDRDGRGYVELATKLDNIRYPNFGGADKDEPFKDPRSFFGVTRAYLTDSGENPKDELTDILPLFKASAASLSAAGERYAAVSIEALTRWAAGKATDDDARWIDWLLRVGLLSSSTSASPKLGELVQQYRETEKQLQLPRVVAGMADMEGFDHPVYIRGDFRNAGEMVQRRYVQAISASEEMSTGGGSGRLALAEEIASASNPLTSRVMVNRIWHYLFGTGLVRTTDDFGHMGEQPSHPELLDWLAVTFSATDRGTEGQRDRGNVSSKAVSPSLPLSVSPSSVNEGLGWSVKKLIRSLVLTETFKMSGQADARAAVVDPENRLLHHYPARRLEAEAIRDSILAVSGRLHRTLYGPSIQPFRAEPMPERRLFPGPLDGSGRRSVYTKITLMQGPKFLEVFNFPDPKTPVGRRDVTNVPAQALTLMNDPFVTGQAEVWAEKLVTAPDVSAAARIDRMYRSAVGRPPSKAETERFQALVRELAALHQVPEGDVLKNRAVWKDTAHAVLNLKEFIYIR